MRTRILAWAGPSSLLALGLFMLHWGWLTWPDPQVDFGREVYVPWQLAQGKHLYADVEYIFGPLSPYLNSLWFRLFGVGLHTIFACNAGILAGLLCLQYRVLRALSDRFAATVACLVFLAVCGLGQLTGISNYNYIVPYRHEIIHGLLLSFLGFSALVSYQRKRRASSVAGIGLCLGFLFLTKAELFVAAATGLIAGLGITLFAQRPDRDRCLRLLLVFTGAALVPPLLSLGLLSLAMPGRLALRGTLGAWVTLLNGAYTSSQFARAYMGLADAQKNMGLLLRYTAAYLLLLLPAAGIALSLRRKGRPRTLITALCFALTLVLLTAQPIRWVEAARPLPLLMMALLGISLLHFVRGQAGPQVALRVGMSLFSLVLLFKIVLQVRFLHYGFALAMPGLLLGVLALLSWLPAAVERFGGHGQVMRAVGLAALLVGTWAHLQWTHDWFRRKIYPVASGVDAFYSDRRGLAISLALEEFKKRTPREETLFVFPEGLMINYLSRRVNPTRYGTEMMPGEVAYFGEDHILAALRTAPPDSIMLVDKNTAEYGVPYFGRDYGQRIYSWILANYHTEGVIGAPPLQGRGFGIQWLRHDARIP